MRRLRLNCDGTRAETRFRLSAKRTSPFKSVGASVQSTTGIRGVRISVSNAGYTMFRGSVKSTGYPLHSPVSPSFPLPCFTMCHHISTGLYVSCFILKAALNRRPKGEPWGRPTALMLLRQAGSLQKEMELSELDRNIQKSCL
jgi:hypothetical protein